MAILADHLDVPSRTLCLMLFMCWTWTILVVLKILRISSKISGLFLSRIFILSFMAIMMCCVLSSAPVLELFSAAPEDKKWQTIIQEQNKEMTFKVFVFLTSKHVFFFKIGVLNQCFSWQNLSSFVIFDTAAGWVLPFAANSCRYLKVSVQKHLRMEVRPKTYKLNWWKSPVMFTTRGWENCAMAIIKNLTHSAGSQRSEALGISRALWPRTPHSAYPAERCPTADPRTRSSKWAWWRSTPQNCVAWCRRWGRWEPAEFSCIHGFSVGAKKVGRIQWQ